MDVISTVVGYQYICGTHRKESFMVWKGVGEMPSHSIAFYEEQFKVYIMENMLGEKTETLKDFSPPINRWSSKWL